MDDTGLRGASIGVGQSIAVVVAKCSDRRPDIGRNAIVKRDDIRINVTSKAIEKPGLRIDHQSDIGFVAIVRHDQNRVNHRRDDH